MNLIRFFSFFLSCTTLLLLCNYFSEAQTYDWTRSGISPGYEYGHGIVCDDSGNVYVTGQLEYTTDFGNGVLKSTAGQHDIYVAKYSPSGTVLWVKTAGSTDGDISLGIGLDVQGNSYITGEFEQTASFGSGFSMTALGGNNIFLAKYNTNGVVQWAKGFTGTGDSRGYAIVTDPQGYSYFTGNFNGTVSFGSLSVNSGSQNTFIAKFSPSGNPVWVKKAGGSGSDRGTGITLDGFGNFYLVSLFGQTASFGGTTVSTTGSSNSTAIAKYDTSGSIIWVKGIGSCCGETNCARVSTDELGNLYLTGSFTEDTKFGNTTFSSAGSTDIFMAKYNANGSLEWAKRAGGTGEDFGQGCYVDQRNQMVYFTGMFDNIATIDGINMNSAGNRDIWIAAYDYSGQIQWVRTAGGVNRDAGFEITTDTFGNIFNTGFFNDLATFGSTSIQGEPLADLFVSKIKPPTAVPPTQASSAIVATVNNCKDIFLNWTPGNGTRRLIVAKAGAPVDEFPVDGTSYLADTIFGTGSNLGNGNYVVYNGSGNNLGLSGLTLGETYHFAIFEYNGNAATSGYNISQYATASQIASSFSISISATSNSICENDSVQLSVTGTMSYQWSPATGLSSAFDSIVMASPQVTTIYTVTGTDGIGCQSVETFNLAVYQLPQVSFVSIPPVCLNTAAFQLTNATPTGGTYSGTGVNSGIFDPLLAGIGNSYITYTFTTGFGCTDSDSTGITINSVPLVNLGHDTLVCYYSSVPLSAGTGFSSWLWSTGATSSSILADNSGVGIGIKTFYVTVLDLLGCSANDTVLINFDACAGITTPLSDISEIKMYPNPFTEALNILSQNILSVRIFDIRGRLVEVMPAQNGIIKAGKLLWPGTYFIELSDKQTVKMFRVIKAEK